MAIRVINDKWALSSRDIWRGAACQHCTDLGMAVATKDSRALAKIEGHDSDPSKILAVIQGNDFEFQLVSELWINLPEGQEKEIVEMEDFASLDKTREVIATGPKVIVQARLEKSYGSVLLGGFADLLIRDDFQPGLTEGGGFTVVPSGREYSGYTVWDIKHNANVKDVHLFQVGGYVEALAELGALSKHSQSGVITRSSTPVGYASEELVAAFKSASTQMFEYMNDSKPDSFKLPKDFVYECTTSSLCEKTPCEYQSLCEQERYDRDDIGQLYRMHPAHRPKLEAAGFDTVGSIANADPSRAKGVIPDEQFAKYQPWARVINSSRILGEPKMASLVDPAEFKSLLPAKNEGDLFVDFEWFQPTGESTELVYMLSASDWDEKFYPFVATTREDEKKAFEDFVGFLIERIEKYPEAHIYHFHTPEPEKLLKLAASYGVLGDEVDQILDRMFDIKKQVVNDRIVTSFGKLGIKQLGKFYLSDHGASSWPDGDEAVEDGLDSMKFFYDYLDAIKSLDQTKADAIMGNILEYNKADCTATSRLYTWLYNGDL